MARVRMGHHFAPHVPSSKARQRQVKNHCVRRISVDDLAQRRETIANGPDCVTREEESTSIQLTEIGIILDDQHGRRSVWHEINVSNVSSVLRTHRLTLE